jgi:hypothetical protein
MIFNDRNDPSVTVHLATRCVHQALYRLQGSLRDVERSDCVGLEEVARINVGARDGDLRRRLETHSASPTACVTASTSRRSPRMTSTSPFTSDGSQSSAPIRCASCTARTRAPSTTRRSTRWLPMNPPTPVKSTVLLENTLICGATVAALNAERSGFAGREVTAAHFRQQTFLAPKRRLAMANPTPALAAANCSACNWREVPGRSFARRS